MPIFQGYNRSEWEALPPTKKLAVWRDRVGGSIRVREQADIEKIAMMCVDAEATGFNCCTWHQSAKFYGTPCHCYRCEQERKGAR